jgi:hypothetical protein
MSTDTAAEIEEFLSVLVGLPMWGSGRAVDMEMFQFGARLPSMDRHGRPTERGGFALHVQCAWHIARDGKVIIASGDVHRTMTG